MQTNTTQKVIILGANGRVSRETAIAFDRAGYETICVTRSGKPVKGLEHLESRAADAQDRASLINATNDADIIFNGLNAPYTKWHEQAMPMAKNVIEACAESGALHLFPGNVYGFGKNMPNRLHEGTPLTATVGKGAIRNKIEAEFERNADRVQTVILRAGDFLGGTQTGSWFDLAIASKINKGKFVYPGPMDQCHAWAYLPDLARTFVAVAKNAAKLPRFEALHFRGHTMTGQQMIQATEKALGKPLRSETIPMWFLRIGSVFVPMWHEVLEVAYLWSVPHELVEDRLAEIIGEVPHTPIVEAISQALADIGKLETKATAPTPRRSNRPSIQHQHQ